MRKDKNKRYLPYSRQHIGQDEIKAVRNVLKSNFITQGPSIAKFENNFKNETKSKYAVACSTGTAALHLSCLALGIKKNDNVITSSITFVASSNCAEYIGANVDFADIDPETFCISTKHLEEKLKKKNIKLVIVVHMCGHSADMKEIFELKKKYNFFIIEDSCHALGGKYKGSNIGSCKYSDISTFSFHPVKPITTAEGGMITTNSKVIYEKLKIFRTHGIHKSPKLFQNKSLAYDKNGNLNRWYYEMSHLGYNFRITDIQASLGIAQLKNLNKFNKKRNQLANNYMKELSKNKFIKVPIIKKDVIHAFHLFTILIDFKSLKKTRNEVMEEMHKCNIGSQVLYIPVFLQPYYQKKYNFKKKNFPNAIEYYNSALSIPLFYNLKTSEQKFIIQNINRIISN
tara:strand:+ start:1854 stop:3053 length:1200 start_codon:yes stop_codon:yes gene_type:complete